MTYYEQMFDNSWESIIALSVIIHIASVNSFEMARTSGHREDYVTSQREKLNRRDFFDM